jgi:hypothetical protein
MTNTKNNSRAGVRKKGELRRFISYQPSTTAVGVAYIENGRLQVAEKPTQDHERAVKALNTPSRRSDDRSRKR